MNRIISIIIISILIYSSTTSSSLTNAQMLGKKCNLPTIPATLDSSSLKVQLFAEYIQNGVTLKSYNNTFEKGKGTTFFTDPNLVSVYNSGEYLHVVYKSVNAAAGSYYYENCDGSSSIPISNTVKTFNAGKTIFGTTIYSLSFRFTLKSI